MSKRERNLPIAKFTRSNHQKHIIEVMPFIAMVFGVQCYLMTQFTSAIDIGDLALALASALIGFVLSLYFYDEKHHILVFEDKLIYGFLGFGRGKEISLCDIEKIHSPEEEKNFASLLIRMKNGKSHILYFVDYPKASKDFLHAQIKALKEAEESADETFAA